MSDTLATHSLSLAGKIGRLVEERGWNQEDFARIADLNRQTVRTILSGGERSLRNSTVVACARALGLPVSDLRHLPLERLLPRMTGQMAAGEDGMLRRLYEQATQPELLSWLERNQERARQFKPEEVEELLSLQGTGGPLTTFGVDHFAMQLERRRKLKEQVDTIAGTEYVDLLEQLLQLMYEKIQPYADRK